MNDIILDITYNVLLFVCLYDIGIIMMYSPILYGYFIINKTNFCDIVKQNENYWKIVIIHKYFILNGNRSIIGLL